MNLSNKFLKHWQKKRFANEDPSFLLAVSGGVDSLVMASLFLEHKIPFAIAHCNFQLRGEESNGDEAFVREFCSRNNVTCFVERFDTLAISESQKKSIQEVARDLRYEWFESSRKEHNFRGVVTAHHADDNAETMLINLTRGTGIAGLHGIPEQNGFIIRPLLFATRKEIEQFASEHGIAYRTDSSNAKDNYLRNFLRHNIIPQLENVMPGFVDRMKETSEYIGEAEQIFKAAVEKECRKLLQKRDNDFYIPIKLLQLKKPLKTICYELFKPFGFTSRQVPFIIDDLLSAESGKFIVSPTHRLIRNRDFLIVTTLQHEATDLILIDDSLEEINTGNGVFTISHLTTIPKELNRGNDVILIDEQKLEQPLILRRWKVGDYFYPLGMGMKKKKLSRYFIDQKVPIHQKENTWVLESNKRIVWVAGFRLDERFKLTDATEKVLRIVFSPSK